MYTTYKEYLKQETSLPFEEAMPVSYTHLDVYKRQAKNFIFTKDFTGKN